MRSVIRPCAAPLGRSAVDSRARRRPGRLRARRGAATAAARRARHHRAARAGEPEPEPEPEPALRQRSQQQLAGAGLRVLLLHDAVLLLRFFLPERHFAYALC